MAKVEAARGRFRSVGRQRFGEVTRLTDVRVAIIDHHKLWLAFDDGTWTRVEFGSSMFDESITPWADPKVLADLGMITPAEAIEAEREENAKNEAAWLEGRRKQYQELCAEFGPCPPSPK